jgi:hypothetical protein
MTDWVLHQFLYSHFNEKVRWALTWKQVVLSSRTSHPEAPQAVGPEPDPRAG